MKKVKLSPSVMKSIKKVEAIHIGLQAQMMLVGDLEVKIWKMIRRENQKYNMEDARIEGDTLVLPHEENEK